MKVVLNEIKKNIQRKNRGEYDAKNQINDLEHNKEKSIQSEQQEERRIRNLWDISKYINIWIIGVPEGEDVQQKIENVFEKLMKTSLIWWRK